MPVVTPTTGAVKFLEYALNISTPTDFKLRLFNNNQTPAGTHQSTDFTEATGAGYSEFVLTGASWTISSTGSGIAIGSATERTFSFTSGDTVYGYTLFSTGTTFLYFAERFTDGPYVVPSGGGDIRVTPDYDLVSSTS